MKRAEDKVLQNFAEVAALGHTEVVKLLLADSRVNPAADDNDAIREAAFMGNRVLGNIRTKYYIGLSD